MPPRGDFLSTEEAAHALGVTVQHVRRLADSGELTRMARGLIDHASLDRYVAEHRGGRTRVWAEQTAWGAIALLTGETPWWLGQVQTSRLRATIRRIKEPAELVARTRDRAKVHTYAGHPASLVRLKEAIAVTHLSVLGLAVEPADSDRLEGYLAVSALDSTVRSLGLREDPTGNIVIRATGFDFAIVKHLAAHSMTLAALDAATSLDPRVRGVGERALAEILESFCDGRTVS